MVVARRVAPLHSGFLDSAERFPERPALEVGGAVLTYRELRERAASVAATLLREASGDDPPLTAVFAYRTATAFAGLLGALLRGHGYVPLNRRFPVERTRLMLEHSGCEALVVDAESARQLDEVLAGVERRLVVVLPDIEHPDELGLTLDRHKVVCRGGLESPSSLLPVDPDPSSLAYLMFTSGSTGTPKGVMVTHGNVRHHVSVIAERYGIDEHDRFSQTNEMTFDMSVLDIFVPWERGACVCCPSQKELIKPGGYVRNSRLTVWYSVPSTAIFMKRLGMLKPDTYPTLRWSAFAGEALPVEVAESWLAAAPNSTVENLFGPTELTDVCIFYRWDPERSRDESEHGSVPIGYPAPEMGVLVADAELREVPPGEEGELLVRGPQVALGYWQQPEKTAAAFVIPPGREEVHYRTGDRVRRPLDEHRPIIYLGRMDHQVQIFGERIELGEVEAVVREESGVDAVVAVGWPVTDTGAAGIEAFVGDPRIDGDQLRRRLRERLPGQMAPRRVHVLDGLPLNDNGKFDRKALMAMLEEAA